MAKIQPQQLQSLKPLKPLLKSDIQQEGQNPQFSENVRNQSWDKQEAEKCQQQEERKQELLPGGMKSRGSSDRYWDEDKKEGEDLEP